MLVPHSEDIQRFEADNELAWVLVVEKEVRSRPLSFPSLLIRAPQAVFQTLSRLRLGSHESLPGKGLVITVLFHLAKLLAVPLTTGCTRERAIQTSQLGSSSGHSRQTFHHGSGVPLSKRFHTERHAKHPYPGSRGRRRVRDRHSVRLQVRQHEHATREGAPRSTADPMARPLGQRTGRVRTTFWDFVLPPSLTKVFATHLQTGHTERRTHTDHEA